MTDPRTGRPQPWLQWFVVCQSVDFEGDNALSLRGIGTLAYVETFPAVVRVVVSTGLLHGDGRPYRYVLELDGSLGRRTLMDEEIEMDDAQLRTINFDLQLSVTEPGVFPLRATLNGYLIAQVTLTVASAPGPPGGVH